MFAFLPPLEGTTVAVTGARGAFGTALADELARRGAKVKKLSHGVDWRAGEEDKADLGDVRILVINHGVKEGSYHDLAVANAESARRLIAAWERTARGDEIASRELWVNTSMAEVLPTDSPEYDLTKRQLALLVDYLQATAPYHVRRMILGAFRSPMTPGAMLRPPTMVRGVLRCYRFGWKNALVTLSPFGLLAIARVWRSVIAFRFARFIQRLVHRGRDTKRPAS